MNRILAKFTISTALALIVLGGLLLLFEKGASLARTSAIGAVAPSAQADISITLEPVTSGFDRPVQVTHAGDGSNRLFVVEQRGSIKIIEGGTVLATPFLEISSLVSCCGERGLLGLAFHPDYETNGYFYVNYTRPGDGDTIIARYSVSTQNSNSADPNSAVVILTVDQPHSNHNGGQLLFGPNDGYLYIGMGDGGSSNDPDNNGQNKETLLGAMLRIDVDNGTPYAIPPDNPYVGLDGADEIWAIGLRNPWRFSFDRATDDLYIGDVGQFTWEEIDYQAANTPGGLNFGWRVREGPCPRGEQQPCAAVPPQFTDPIAYYPNGGDNQAVTGGFVYRGTLYPNLEGRYFYADYNSGIIWSIFKTGPNPDDWSTPEELLDAGFPISSFGEDEDGELYVVQYADSGSGAIYRLADAGGSRPNLANSTKNTSSPSANPGEVVSYTIHLNNSGGLSTETAFLTDTLPTGLNYIPGTLAATQGAVDDSQGSVLFWQGQLTPTKNITITYQVTPSNITGSLVNQAQLTGSSFDPVTLSTAIFVPRSVLTTTHDDFFLPGTQPGALDDDIPASDGCDFCHTAPIYDKWRGSMMSQASRDPLMWAALAVANNDAPGAGDYCLRCHSPKGWLEGRSHPADGSALQTEDIEAGVACEVCHRLVDPIPSSIDETVAIDANIRAALTTTVPISHMANAMMIADPADNRRGPFAFDPDLPYHTAYQTEFLGGATNNVTLSRVCGTCHNVDNPILSWNDTPPNGAPPQYWPNQSGQAAPSVDKDELFPIERTFDEWLNSDYATTGVYAPQFAGDKPDGIVGSCQDCHMRRTTGKAAEDIYNPVERDCLTTGCLPEHSLVGGNTWVPQILQDTRWRLHGAGDAEHLNGTIIQAREMLQKAATLTVTLTTTGTEKVAIVRVTNETGHKLPTGYPEGRRLWLNFKAFNNGGDLIYESGAYDPATAILSQDPDLKIYEAKQGLTPELADLLNLPAGESFHFVLNNTVVKDNRIPPRGYTQTAFDEPGLRPVGATYLDGQYWDDTIYPVPAETERIIATLYYQTSSKEYIDFLRTNGNVDGVTVGELWDSSKSPPEVMATAQFPPVQAPPSNFHHLPIIFKNAVSAPDLVVDNLIANSNAVTVVINNVGNRPVVDAFWVDLYINPTAPPSLNQPWSTIASQGLTWGIVAPALPLTPNDLLTLTLTSPYYVAEESDFTPPLAPDTPVWAQVDSVNFDTTYGNVLESNEKNNIFGPAPSGAGVINATDQGRSASREGLPLRR